MFCVYKHTAPNGKVYIGITGRNPLASAFYGKHHTADARKKISDSQYNPVLQYSIDGTFISEYANPYQAQIQTGVHHVLEVCKRLRKSAGGYIWRFKEE